VFLCQRPQGLTVRWIACFLSPCFLRGRTVCFSWPQPEDVSTKGTCYCPPFTCKSDHSHLFQLILPSMEPKLDYRSLAFPCVATVPLLVIGLTLVTYFFCNRGRKLLKVIGLRPLRTIRTKMPGRLALRLPVPRRHTLSDKATSIPFGLCMDLRHL
jgi:hypothetical protein